MNFKSIGLAGLAAATLISAATVTAAPANASSIAGSKLAFGGQGRFTINNAPSKSSLNFFPFSGSFPDPTTASNLNGGTFGRANIITDGSTGYFGGLPNNQQFRIKDLNFTTVTPGSKWTLALAAGQTFVDDFFKFKDGVTFDLTSFILNKDASSGLIGGTYTGIFADTDGKQIPGLDGSFSSFTAKFTLAKGDVYGSSITPIPTPALLPGLLGLGVAALRKRKSEGSEVEAAETAKA